MFVADCQAVSISGYEKDLFSCSIICLWNHKTIEKSILISQVVSMTTTAAPMETTTTNHTHGHHEKPETDDLSFSYDGSTVYMHMLLLTFHYLLIGQETSHARVSCSKAYWYQCIIRVPAISHTRFNCFIFVFIYDIVCG